MMEFIHGMVYGAGLVAISVLAYRAVQYWNSPEDLGIYPAPDGNSVYLAGEACTVNWSPDPIAMHGRLDWCWEQYNHEQHGILR
jgi:hypothetical protein